MKLSTEMEHRGRVYVAAVVTTYGVFHVTKEVHAKLKVMERFPYQCVARGCEGCLVCEVRK